MGILNLKFQILKKQKSKEIKEIWNIEEPEFWKMPETDVLKNEKRLLAGEV